MLDPENAIEVQGLRKSFGEQVVLDGIDLQVPRGTVTALLGANGAGKTTTVQILSTLMDADGGTARIDGHDVAKERRAVRGVIGVTGQFSAVDDLLTGEENLRLMADLHHLPKRSRAARVHELLETFDILDAAQKPAAAYSGGMKRRLDLAMSLVGQPSIIFLDEPTTGLDPRSRRVLWQIIRDLVKSGVTILLTTQYLEEADQLADRVALLDQGRIVASGTPEELKRQMPGGHVQMEFADGDSMHRALVALPGARQGDAEFTLQIPGDGGVQTLKSLFETLDSAGVEVEDLTIHKPDLDDVFLSLTGRPINSAINTSEVSAQ